jgi:uncharacterized protein YhbP (UPF0306 family)
MNSYEDHRRYTLKEKLEGLPRIYITSVEKNENRREVIRSQFYLFDIQNYSFFITTPEQDSNRKIVGKRIENVDPRMHLVTAAYLEAIRHWYETTDEEYALFLEDDIFFETARYWNFTWKDFVSNLPENWEVIHLGSVYMMHPDWNYKQLNNRLMKSTYYDSCLMSLIRRPYAKTLIQRYIVGENEYNFTPPYVSHKLDADPYCETLIYMSTENSYRFMLFTENPYYGVHSTFRPFDYSLSFDGGNSSYPVSFISPKFTKAVIEWWEKIGSKTDIKELLTLTTNGVDE